MRSDSSSFPPSSGEVADEAAASERRREEKRARRLALAAVAAPILLVAGATQGLSVPGSFFLLAGLALAVWSARIGFRSLGRTGRLGLGACVGMLLLVVGLVIGAHTYDAEYFGDPYPGWRILDVVGFGATVIGFFLLVFSLVAVPISLLSRAGRRTKG